MRTAAASTANIVGTNQKNCTKLRRAIPTNYTSTNTKRNTFPLALPLTKRRGGATLDIINVSANGVEAAAS